MIKFLKIPRDAAERMWMVGPWQIHRNWWPEESECEEKRLRLLLKGRIYKVRSELGDSLVCGRF